MNINRMYLGHAFLLFALSAVSAHSADINFDGEFFLCNATCDSFRAFGGELGGATNTVNSQLTGVIDIPVNADGTFEFSASDDVTFDFAILAPDEALSDPMICTPPSPPDQICNMAGVNPMPVTNRFATVAGSGTVGTDGLPESGTLTFTWTTIPLSSNDARIIIDVSTARATGTLFGGVVTFFQANGSFSDGDDDDDGVGNAVDNCSHRANSAQRDTDNDGFGNQCDADLDNNCAINIVDLGLLRSVFFSQNDDADFNGDGAVNVVDLGLMRATFFQAPGPSALMPVCEPRSPQIN